MNLLQSLSKKVLSLALLAALTAQSAACVKPSKPTYTVLPPTPCYLPPQPSPKGELEDLRDCDAEGPGTDVCMSEKDLYIIMVYVKQLKAWADLSQACPGVEEITTEVPTPQVESVTDERAGA